MKPLPLCHIFAAGAVCLAVNALFVCKYAPANTSPTIWTAGYAVAAACCVAFFFRMKMSETAARRAFVALAVAVVGVHIVMLMLIAPEGTMVDRASGLSNWNRYLAEGIFPYHARTHCNQPLSVFPVWAVLFFPFYLAGDVGIALPLLLTLFFVFLYRRQKPRSALLWAVLFALSPACWWHGWVRSDLLSNMLCVLLFCLWTDDRCQRLQKHTTLIALAAGLLACSRMIAPVALFFFFFPHWRNWKPRRRLTFAAIAAAAFALPLVVCFLVDSAETYNCCQLQTTRQIGDLKYLALVALLMICLWAMKRKEREKAFWTYAAGMALFTFIALTMLVQVLSFGLCDTLSQDRFDISYLSVCLPFLFYYISTHYECKKTGFQSD